MVYLKRAVEINPRFGEVWGDLGQVYSEIKFMPDSAIYFYKRCVKATPGAAGSYTNLGVVYFRIRKYKLASFCFNRAVEINPNLADPRRYSEELKKATGLDIHIYPTEEDSDPTGQQTPDLRVPVYQH
jgi:tetratricopeptide (TPR) repeat protein